MIERCGPKAHQHLARSRRRDPAPPRSVGPRARRPRGCVRPSTRSDLDAAGVRGRAPTAALARAARRCAGGPVARARLPRRGSEGSPRRATPGCRPSARRSRCRREAAARRAPTFPAGHPLRVVDPRYARVPQPVRLEALSRLELLGRERRRSHAVEPEAPGVIRACGPTCGRTSSGSWRSSQ